MAWIPAHHLNISVGSRLRKRTGNGAVPRGDVGTVVRIDSPTVYLRMDNPRQQQLTENGGVSYHWSTDSLRTWEVEETAESYTTHDGRTWTVGQRVRVEGRQPDLATVLPRGSIYSARGSDRWVELRFDSGYETGYADQTVHPVETAPAQSYTTDDGRVWTVGQLIQATNGRARVRMPSESEVRSRLVDGSRVFYTYEGGGTTTNFDRHRYITALGEPEPEPEPEPVPASPAATPGEVTFTPEQQARIREVTARRARSHGACAVAAQTLRELGIDQPHEVREVTLALELVIPIRNTDHGQVQLPESVPENFAAGHISSEEVNAIVDRLLESARVSGYPIRREGTARLVTREVRES